MEYEVDGEVNTSDFSLESNFENQVTWWDDIKWIAFTSPSNIKSGCLIPGQSFFFVNGVNQGQFRSSPPIFQLSIFNSHLT